MERSDTPWTNDEVAFLNAYQQAGTFTLLRTVIVEKHCRKATPALGEKMCSGRCDEHGDPKVLNHDLVEECSREEYLVADVMCA